MLALIIKRAIDVKATVDVNALAYQGYNPAEIADYMYMVTMAQVKKDIVPITITEAAAYTGASIELCTEKMKKILNEKYNHGGDK
jgi:hypothetical protein